LRVHENGVGGLTYLGLYNSSFGPEYAFATGDNVGHRYPADSGYILLHATIEKAATSFKVLISPAVEGISGNDEVRYRYALVSGDKVITRGDWSPGAKAEFSANEPLTGNFTLDVQVALAGHEQPYRLKFPLTDTNPLLADRPE